MKEKFEDIKVIKELETMKVACFTYFGDDPETYAFDVLKQWAKEHDIPVGAGRGSGVSSIIAYSMGITDVEPLQYDLLFERFLNKERVSMPDFDVDFCTDRRQEVIEYVREKYGHDNVAQIVTFGNKGRCKGI